MINAGHNVHHIVQDFRCFLYHSQNLMIHGNNVFSIIDREQTHSAIIEGTSPICRRRYCQMVPSHLAINSAMLVNNLSCPQNKIILWQPVLFLHDLQLCKLFTFELRCAKMSLSDSAQSSMSTKKKINDLPYLRKNPPSPKKETPKYVCKQTLP